MRKKKQEIDKLGFNEQFHLDKYKTKQNNRMTNSKRKDKDHVFTIATYEINK